MATPDIPSQGPAEIFTQHEKFVSEHKPLWSLKRWFGKEDNTQSPSSSTDEPQGPGVTRCLSRKVIPGLPRPGTFKRQQSELRDNLEPIQRKPEERRAVSVDRRRNIYDRDFSRPVEVSLPRLSAPVVMDTVDVAGYSSAGQDFTAKSEVTGEDGFAQVSVAVEPDIAKTLSLVDSQSISADGYDDDLSEELEKKWILNLSMHFRDRSNREKFFVTYAESPSHWRRVTISLDYRDAPLGSLEEDLQQTRFQRDKSARIYDSIRESLPDIQFYDTVTNLKLQTEHDRLHVHVTEDIHEVIHYPSITSISHLHCRRIREDALVFDSHLSGFVYKIRVNEEVFIKKEIPGPDTVEEFLYEINALHRLSGSDSVIQFGGVIVDNEERLLKGLLISYAEKGALIDIIFDGKGQLSWARRERWARQIVQGLSEIHEAGFVQGDFTLSNIVIDADDRAKIIDINRRGCPVGWEPPEVAALIESKQRVSMYIGVKSDIFQLGMVLWAIAMEEDEPEVQPRPLTLSSASDDIPSYYRAIIGICLSDDPRNRCHATALLQMFPEIIDDDDLPHHYQQRVSSDQYIDPTTVVDRDDIDGFARSSATHIYVNAPTDVSGEPFCFVDNEPSFSAIALHTPSDGQIIPSSREAVDDKALHNYFDLDAQSVQDDTFSVLDKKRGRSPSPRSATKRLEPLSSNGLRARAIDDRTASAFPKELNEPSEQPSLSMQKNSLSEAPDDDQLRARIVTASPSRHRPHGSAEYFSKLPSPDGSIDRGLDRPQETVLRPKQDLDVLAGVGEHSGFDYLVFPHGDLDDDLTTDTQ